MLSFTKKFFKKDAKPTDMGYEINETQTNIENTNSQTFLDNNETPTSTVEIEDGWNYLSLASLSPCREVKIDNKQQIHMLHGVPFTFGANVSTPDCSHDKMTNRIIKNLSCDINLECYSYNFALEQQIVDNNQDNER